MILVIGGAYQGKKEYVYETLLKEPDRQGREYLVIDQYHLRIREQMQEGLESLEEARKLIEGAEDKIPVVICNEVGCGVVPMDAFERAWREKVGRVCCFFAKEAEQVVRVVCGVGNRIK